MACSSAAFLTSTIATSILPATTVTGVVHNPITFDTVLADNNGFWDASHPTRLTIPQAGLYAIGGNVEFTANVKGERLVLIRKNGDSANGLLGHGENYVPSTVATDTPQVHCHIAAVLNAGDYVELIAFAAFEPVDAVTLQSRHVVPITPQFAISYQGPVA